MTAAIQSAQLFLLAGVLFLALGSVGTAVLVRMLEPRLAASAPRVRHRALVFLASLPVLTSVGLLLSACLPSLVALAFPDADHCAGHDDGHAHLCFVHTPKLGTNPALVLGLALGISYVLMRAVLSASGIVRATRIVEALARTGEHRPDLGVTIVETRQPVCLAAGLFRPRVLLSRGLLETLSDEERAIVLAHERTHVRRRDAFVVGVVRALTLLHLPGVGRWLVREVEIAAEQVCDEEAARYVDDRVAVASAILTVEREAQHASARELGAVAVAFGASAVERRVESLLAEPLPPGSLRGVFFGAVLVAVGLFVMADELHHLTESLLSVIAH